MIFINIVRYINPELLNSSFWVPFIGVFVEGLIMGYGICFLIYRRNMDALNQQKKAFDENKKENKYYMNQCQEAKYEVTELKERLRNYEKTEMRRKINKPGGFN